MNLLDYNSIRDFYNLHKSCWPTDLFSEMTTSFIDKYVIAALKCFDGSNLILNAGSGGKLYPTCAQQFHIDIAENTLIGIENAYVSNIIDMPFENNTFDCVICVGSVINYCEINKAIAEINRVLKVNGTLIIEYERSGSGFAINHARNKDLIIFFHTYFGEPHKNLLYSDKYFFQVLKKNGFIYNNLAKFNTTIPFCEMFASDKFAHKMKFFEPLLRRLPIVSQYSHNAILTCKKVINLPYLEVGNAAS